MYDAGCTVGGINCDSRGYIGSMDIKPAARRCGISTILISMCLIDKDINGRDGNLAVGGMRRKNRGLEKLLDIWTPSLMTLPDLHDWAVDKCRSLWYLRANFNPESAGFFFNAAINCGYKYMIIVAKNGNFGPERTETWRGLYNRQTGDIEDPNGKIEAWDGYWMFCD